ncbi:hypothetical protein C0Z01_16225 [Photobacterium kishitanii]|uniref:Uncharacterized protein n=1 Tax=Photobacterium kishitanii TaxID=318456 RepID=A0A0B7JCT3_9GAMM|nr:hypothetical protein [Photobacterium kishitanii]OBU27240.1 hypothetical protein AYY22_03085 [Photobacterium kishitanii]PSU87107.1 hypothetical protein C0W42_17590 [Photobacterium kishitanii]PSU90472.1 hypothetical protein C0W35_16450 [Photobacterium kishitanii]PSU99874.1 hypothetical protein C9J27_06390 [Photobacterium kishitanii]PSV09125.1 hypothetical protein C0W28_20685 [Photobacterium kishitanii]
MDELQLWLASIKAWYLEDNPNNIAPLITIITATPTDLFTTSDPNKVVSNNNLRNDHQHEEALAYWLDGCQKICQYHRQQQPQLAFTYIQLPYAKLQALVCDPQQSAAIKRWGLKKLDSIIVTLLEFCQGQQQQHWQQQSNDLIDLHVIFMAAQQHLNLKY